ncbi:hypothetical protein CCACVL1_30860 [Corchorus capsularis]|uniref:Uncharacterized protein n=1 Tax=Corchorus capsularis TaxID=210143 RepID=A0A1R3FUY0_COCAP|nr:hypothetical protein CCACVL1_30860 [Corchorus capsularis]
MAEGLSYRGIPISVNFIQFND